ncbi:hypothetical protein MRX96_015470 [Rhipicephalus microplus]
MVQKENHTAIGTACQCSYPTVCTGCFWCTTAIPTLARQQESAFSVPPSLQSFFPTIAKLQLTLRVVGEQSIGQSAKSHLPPGRWFAETFHPSWLGKGPSDPSILNSASFSTRITCSPCRMCTSLARSYGYLALSASAVSHPVLSPD